MAWNAASTAQLIMFFRDDDGAVSRHLIHLPMDAISSAVEVAKQYGALVQAVSNCALWKMHIVFGAWSDGPVRGSPGSSIYNNSVFVFQTMSTPLSRYVFDVPGAIASKLLQPPDPYAGIQFDVADPDIAALVSAMVNGIADTRPVAPWEQLGDWTNGGSSGGSWGGGSSGGSWGGGSSGGSWGGGSSGGDWSWPPGGTSGGPWGDGGIGSDFAWTGDLLVKLLVAYRGIDGTRRKW